MRHRCHDEHRTAADLNTAAPVPPAGRTVHMPGDGAMWVMVLGDFVFFGAYFIIFMIYRAMAPQEFLESQQHLNLTIGVVNTLVLLTSSWFIARSVQTARSGDHEGALRLTYLGGVCGVLFILIKAYDGRRKSPKATPCRATSSSCSITCSPVCTCSTSDLAC